MSHKDVTLTLANHQLPNVTDFVHIWYGVHRNTAPAAYHCTGTRYAQGNVILQFRGKNS